MYRIVVVDARKRRAGRQLEESCKYHHQEDPSYSAIVSARAPYWLGVGAQPSDAVAKLLKITGDWQKFKGVSGTEGTLKVAEPKRDKLEIFNEALKDAASEPKTEAVTRRAAKKSAEKPADEPAEDKAEDKGEKAEKPAEAPAEEAAAEAPVAEEPAPVPADETPEGAADAAETAETADAKTEA